MRMHVHRRADLVCCKYGRRAAKTRCAKSVAVNDAVSVTSANSINNISSFQSISNVEHQLATARCTKPPIKHIEHKKSPPIRLSHSSHRAFSDTTRYIAAQRSATMDGAVEYPFR